MADRDSIKMIALGRSFSIGTLYNYVEDIAIPNARLWDPDDVSRMSVISTEKKEIVKVHSMSCALQTTEEEDHSSWLSELDEHSAMSLTAGLFRSPFTGAWQFVSDRAGSSSRGPEVAIHCRSSSRKVSIDPKSQLEIICRPERIIKNKATHVVVAVKFGLEAFCVFQNPEVSTTNDAEASVSEKMSDYANFFAKGLSDGRKKLELDHDKEGDEEDGGHDLVPADLRCILYKDVLGVKKGQRSWTSNSVVEQYESCRKILDHQVNKAIPLKIWLYPLAKLMPTEAGIIQLPENKINVSRHLVIKCQIMWKQWQHIRMETEAIKTEISQRSTAQRCWIPLAVSKRINDFDKCLNEFMSAMQQALYEWTISIRRGGEPEEKMAEMVAAVERKSPFIPEELENWLIDHRKQLKTLKTLSQLPGVHLVTEFKQLKKEIKSLGHNVLAVVLHLPSISEPFDRVLQELRSYLDAFTKSHPALPAEWIREVKVDHRCAANRRRFISVAQEFSEWVTNSNSVISNVRYIIYYNDQPICGAAELPFLRLYDSTFESNVNFTIPKAPGPVTVDRNYRGVITLSWTTVEEVEEPNYLLQYCSIDRSGVRWDSIQHHSNEITISHLQSEESYVFRVAVVTPGGRSPFSPVSSEVTIDPVCPPPAGLQCQYVTVISITISWDHVEIEEEDDEADTSDDEDYEDVNSSSDFDDGSICNRMLESKDSVQHVKEIKNKKSVISCYLIDCWMAGNQDSSFIQRSTTETVITLEPLDLGTTYCIQVRAVCNDGAGSSFYSPATPILEAETLEEAERAAHIVRRVSKKCPVGPGIDAYRLPLKKRHGTKTQGVGHYVFGEPSYLALAGKRRQRTILMLGATGSGKSTLINAMVNYMLGVEWDDDFRFKLIDEPANKSQAHSQTDLVTTYDLYEMKGSRLNYSLTVVDTPGFGDTRGLEKDKKIMQQIQYYFQCRHGIQQLEAVCFVVQSSLPRLTATQKYIFDSILSIFGQDIKDNIRLMVTFSDGALPPVLGAVKEAGIPSPMDPATGLPLHHKFNNSIFFTSNKGDRQTNEFNRTYFDMAVGGFDKFFDDLGVMEAKSLTLTREVLEERKRLEALVEGLQMKTEIKLTRVDELEKIKKILKENEDQMDANQAFEFETLVPKSTDISGTGQFITNCQNCRTTCHFPCRQAHDNDKHRCSVMDRRSGSCVICKCPWNVHFNQKYRYEMVKEKVQRSSDAIRQQYQGAKNEALTNEQLLARIEKEIKKHESQLMELMKATYPCIQRLDEIALRPHSFSAPDYIDLLIAAEKQEHRPGYQQRIVTLHKLREMADITAKLIRDGQPVVSIPSREDHIQSKNSKSSLSLLKSKIVCEKKNFPKVHMGEVKCDKGFSAYNCKRCKKTCEKPAKIKNFEKKMCTDRHCKCPPSAHVYQHFSLSKIKEKVTTPLLDMKAEYESVVKCPVTPAQPGKVNAGSCGRGRGFLLTMDSTGSPGESTYSGRGKTSSRSAQNYSGSSKIPSAGPGTASAIDPRYQSKMSGTNSHVAASTTSFSSPRKTEETKAGGGAVRGTGCGIASKWQENEQGKGNAGSFGRGRGFLLAMDPTGSPGEPTHFGRRSAQNYSGSSKIPSAGTAFSGSASGHHCQSRMSGTNSRVSDPASTTSFSTQRKTEVTMAGGVTGYGHGSGRGIASKWQENSMTPAQQEKVNLGSCGRGRGMLLNLLAMGSTGSPRDSTHSGRGETSSRSAQNYSGSSASGSGSRTDPRCPSKMSGTNGRVSDPVSTSSSSTQRITEETKADGGTGHGHGRGRGIVPKWQFPHSSYFKDGRLIGYFSSEPENYYNNLSGKAQPKPSQKKEEDGHKPDVTSKGNANEPLSSEEETEQRAQQPKKAESLFWKFLNFFSRSPK